MLHIVNGKSTATTLRQASVPGEIFSFRDALVCGPTPSGIDGQEWRRIRSEHLSRSYGVELKACEKDLLKQDEILLSSSSHEEVVLWFEHDLFCQINLLYLLNWFAQRSLGQTKLSLINVGEFPGHENFRGLGELNAEELGSLFPERRQVTAAGMNLAGSAWAAYCSSDPTAIERLLKTDTSTLPFLKPAFEAHLKRFPAIKNGLGRIESSSLELVHSGLERFVDLFPKFANQEPIYGFGDAQLWLALHMLITAREPLLNFENGTDAAKKLTPEVVQKARLKLTDLGLAVLKGEEDFVARNEIDLWLGGFHLRGRANIWRWNEEAAKLVLS